MSQAGQREQNLSVYVRLSIDIYLYVKSAQPLDLYMFLHASFLPTPGEGYVRHHTGHLILGTCIGLGGQMRNTLGSNHFPSNQLILEL